VLIIRMNTDLGLLRLLQLVSPGLPIGMYSYSQGFESAVDEGWVSNAEEAGEWINGIMENCLVKVDVPVTMRLYDAWSKNDLAIVEHWSSLLLACRESSELRDEDRQTGQALARLLKDMDLEYAKPWLRKPETTLAAMFALGAFSWGVPRYSALVGYLWSWLENQVLCAVKLVPLGQVAGQRLLHELATTIPALVEQAMVIEDDEIGGSTFGLTLASSRHEIQYSRLFRS
jgi:urease accessory protein